MKVNSFFRLYACCILVKGSKRASITDTQRFCLYLIPLDLYNILKDMGMPVEERTEIMMAIGNHDEQTGTAVSDISAALILADKSDAHRSRVSKKDRSLFDKHDEVNYAVTSSELKIDIDERKVILNLTIDTKICPVIDYFEIFMDRTKMSKRAAKYLGLWFELIINDTKLL